MNSIAPFRAADVGELELIAAQQDELHWQELAGGLAEAALAWEEAGNAFTVRGDDGRIIFCGGAVQRHAGYATLWGLFGARIGPAAGRYLLRVSRHYLAGLPYRRVDALVEDREAANRWALRAGMELEARLAGAAPNGGDMMIYRRKN